MSRIPGTTETRTALLDAALICFGEHGFDGTSIRMVADRAGRPFSLISHHFGGKEGLYLEAFKLIFQRPNLMPLAGKEPDPRPVNRAEAIQQFRETMHLLYTLSSRPIFMPNPLDVAARSLFLREMQSPRHEVLELLKEVMSPWKEQILACIHLLRPELKEPEVAFFGSAILGQAIVHGLTQVLLEAIWGPNRLSQFKSAEMLTEFMLNGLGIHTNE
jgi:AcrR family transcriptional regulator